MPPKKKEQRLFGPTVLKRVLRMVHPKLTMMNDAKGVVLGFLEEYCDKIAGEAVKFMHSSKKRTLSSRDIQTAVRMVLPGELAKHAMSEGVKAVTKMSYPANAKGSIGKRVGLQFPIGSVKRRIKERFNPPRIGRSTSVYLTAVMEYLCAEVMELAGNACQQSRKKRVTSRHVFLAITHDEELSNMAHNTCMQASGVLPNINPVIERQRRSASNGRGRFGAKKPACRRPGQQSRAHRKLIANIRNMQKSTATIIPKCVIKRTLRQEGQTCRDGLRFSAEACDMFQQSVEHYLMSVLKDSLLCAIHARRTGVMPRDIHLARRLRGERF